MLAGAVTFGEDFEQNYMKQIFCLEKGMTQAISHFSRFDDASIKVQDGKYQYHGQKKKDALTKIKLFYFVSIFTLIGVAVVLFLLTAQIGSLAQGSSRSSNTRIGTPTQHVQ
jgi:hypothetical protein